MKKWLVAAVLCVHGYALAQGSQSIRLKEAIAEFPRSQLQLKTTDRDVIFVAPDNQTVRADVLPRVTKTINVATRAGAQQNVTEIVTVLLTLLNLRQISTIDNSIVMTDTPENVAFSERIVNDLSR